MKGRLDATLRATMADPEQIAVIFMPVGGPEDAAAADRLDAILSPLERSRRDRFRFPEDRLQYAAAHLLLRHCLGIATGRRDWSFREGPYGRPELEPPHGSPPLMFNLTHVRDWVACVLAKSCTVGIDVERVRAIPDMTSIVGNMFSLGEQHVLAAADPGVRLDLFFMIWTMKEAIVKASGDGLSADLARFTVDPTTSAVRFLDKSDGESAQWRIARRRIGADVHLALSWRADIGTPVDRKLRWIPATLPMLAAMQD